MPSNAEVQYHVLPNRSNPYLLARVRWPDVAHAISAARPEWQADPGLFDLPYDKSSVAVSPDEAAAIAKLWGTRLPSDTEPLTAGPQLIRRMPANWSNLSPAELRAWSLDLVVTRPRLRTKQPSGEGRARTSLRSRLGFGYRQQPPAVLAELTQVESIPAIVMNGNGVADHGDDRALVALAAVDRRRHERVQIDGRARIRSGRLTISAELVDLSTGGVHFTVPTRSILEVGARLGSPLILKRDDPELRVRLQVTGTVTWQSDSATGTHLGVAFDDPDETAVEKLQDLLAS